MMLASTSVHMLEVPEMPTTCVYVPRVSSHCLLPLCGNSPQLEGSSDQALLKFLLWVSTTVRFCVRSLRVESLFP